MPPELLLAAARRSGSSGSQLDAILEEDAGGGLVGCTEAEGEGEGAKAVADLCTVVAKQ